MAAILDFSSCPRLGTTHPAENDDSSIFSAEAKAIQIALEAIRGSKAGPYIIFSDSLSCLQAIQNYCDNPFIIEII